MPVLYEVIILSRNSYEENCSFGKSMFAGYSHDYMSDFVLQGCRDIDQTKLAQDLLNTVKVRIHLWMIEFSSRALKILKYNQKVL